MARRQKLFYVGEFEFTFADLIHGTVLMLLLNSALKKLTFYIRNELPWTTQYVITYHMDNTGSQPQLNSGTPLLEIVEEANVIDTVAAFWIPDDIVFGIIPVTLTDEAVMLIQRNLDILYHAGELVNIDIIIDSIVSGTALAAGATQIIFELEFDILCS